MLKDFYEDQEIFLTGGSGVLGKAFLEKILRSCNIRQFYLLIRSKKGVNAKDRLNDLKGDPIFSRLHSEKPKEFDEKVTLISGDAALPLLGIASEDAERMSNVSLVVHSAATVRFDESLRNALTLNVAGTWETLKFAETLKHLKCFFYVSTYYSNPYLSFIEPVVYDSPMKWRTCMKLLDNTDISDEMLDAITRKLTVGFTNTYCFTKNLAESVVNDYRHKMPVAIFRPAIITYSLKEPIPGYPTAATSAVGLLAAIGGGVLKAIPMGEKVRQDIVPLDCTVKLMSFYVLKATKLYESSWPAETPVYIVSSSTCGAYSLRDYIEMMERCQVYQQSPYTKAFLIPGAKCHSSAVLCSVNMWWKQLFPAMLGDLLMRICGQRTVFMQIQRKLYSTLQVMEPFFFNNFDSNGVSHLDEVLESVSGTEFNLDEIQYSSDYYYVVGTLQNFYAASRCVYLQEEPSSIPTAQKILKAKIFVYRILQIICAYQLFNKFTAVTAKYQWFGSSEDGMNIHVDE